MLTVKAHYENGRIVLPEAAPARPDGPVLVTFLDAEDLAADPAMLRFLEAREGQRAESQVLFRAEMEKARRERENSDA